MPEGFEVVRSSPLKIGRWGPSVEFGMIQIGKNEEESHVAYSFGHVSFDEWKRGIW